MAAAEATVARLNATIASLNPGYFEEGDRRRALETLAKLDPATLAKQAEAFVAMFRDEAEEFSWRTLDDGDEKKLYWRAWMELAMRHTMNRTAWSELARQLTTATAELAKLEVPFEKAFEARLYETLQELVRPEALAMLSDVLISLIETSEADTRMAALSVMRLLKPETFAQYADAVIARLEDSDWDCRRQALETLRLKLNPSTLAQHADAILARLVDESTVVRSEALRTLQMLEPLALAQHADAVVAQYADAVLARLGDSDMDCRLQALETLGLQLKPSTLAQDAAAILARLLDESEMVRMEGLYTLKRLEPLALAQHADAVVARLEDTDWGVRTAALNTLRKLEPARLARYATDVFRMFGDANAHVCCAARLTLRVLPRSVIGPVQSRFENGVSMRNYLMGRVGWYRLRLRLRLKCLLLYWYALPYRPSGAGHARDVEAWERMVGSQDQGEVEGAKKRQAKERAPQERRQTRHAKRKKK